MPSHSGFVRGLFLLDIHSVSACLGDSDAGGNKSISEYTACHELSVVTQRDSHVVN